MTTIWTIGMPRTTDHEALQAVVDTWLSAAHDVVAVVAPDDGPLVDQPLPLRRTAWGLLTMATGSLRWRADGPHVGLAVVSTTPLDGAPSHDQTGDHDVEELRLEPAVARLLGNGSRLHRHIHPTRTGPFSRLELRR